jgi:hypothetical protein
MAQVIYFPMRCEKCGGSSAFEWTWPVTVRQPKTRFYCKSCNAKELETQMFKLSVFQRNALMDDLRRLVQRKEP